MKTVIEDHPASWGDSPAPGVGAEEPDHQQEAPASTAPDEPEHQMLEEPGYGHGV